MRPTSFVAENCSLVSLNRGCSLMNPPLSFSLSLYIYREREREVQTRTLTFYENTMSFFDVQNHIWFTTNGKNWMWANFLQLKLQLSVVNHMWFCMWIICDFVRESYVILYVNHIWFCTWFLYMDMGMWIIYDFVHRKSSSRSRMNLHLYIYRD